MVEERFIDFCRSPKKDVLPVVTLMMKNLNEKFDNDINQENYHAVTLKESVLSDDSVTITLSDSRPEMDKTSLEIPLSELPDYDSGKSVVFETGKEDEREEWSLGDKLCYYLVFN